jgi:hypothetical protein
VQPTLVYPSHTITSTLHETIVQSLTWLVPKPVRITTATQPPSGAGGSTGIVGGPVDVEWSTKTLQQSLQGLVVTYKKRLLLHAKAVDQVYAHKLR